MRTSLPFASSSSAVCLVSGSCPSARIFAPRFLQTPPHSGSPCASLSLLLHQDVKGTSTPKLSSMHGVQGKGPAAADPLFSSNCHLVVMRRWNDLPSRHKITDSFRRKRYLPDSWRTEGGSSVHRDPGPVTRRQLIGTDQFSILRSGTRPNSRVLLVTTVSPRLRAWAAMKRSLAPIMFPLCLRAARI